MAAAAVLRLRTIGRQMTIKIRLGKLYPSILTRLGFLASVMQPPDELVVEFELPGLDDSHRDQVDSLDWKKLTGLNLKAWLPSNIYSVLIAFRADHLTGQWAVTSYFNHPDSPNGREIGWPEGPEQILAYYRPYEVGRAIIRRQRLYQGGWTVQFQKRRVNEGWYDYNGPAAMNFGFTPKFVRLVSPTYGGKDDNGDGIGAGYPGPARKFEFDLLIEKR